jgi:hypothetical protein
VDESKAKCAIILLTALWHVLSVSKICDKNAHNVINGLNNRFLYFIFSSEIGIALRKAETLINPHSALQI